MIIGWDNEFLSRQNGNWDWSRKFPWSGERKEQNFKIWKRHKRHRVVDARPHRPKDKCLTCSGNAEEFSDIF